MYIIWPEFMLSSIYVYSVCNSMFIQCFLILTNDICIMVNKPRFRCTFIYKHSLLIHFLWILWTYILRPIYCFHFHWVTCSNTQISRFLAFPSNHSAVICLTIGTNSCPPSIYVYSVFSSMFIHCSLVLWNDIRIPMYCFSF